MESARFGDLWSMFAPIRGRREVWGGLGPMKFPLRVAARNLGHLGVETDLDLVDLQVSWVALLRGTTKINLRFDFSEKYEKNLHLRFGFPVLFSLNFLDRRRFVTSTNYRVIGFVESSDIFGYLRCFEKTLGPRNLRPTWSKSKPKNPPTPEPIETGQTLGDPLIWSLFQGLAKHETSEERDLAASSAFTIAVALGRWWIFGKQLFFRPKRKEEIHAKTGNPWLKEGPCTGTHLTLTHI